MLKSYTRYERPRNIAKINQASMMTVEDWTARDKINNNLSDPFGITTAVKPGVITSPVLTKSYFRQINPNA